MTRCDFSGANAIRVWSWSVWEGVLVEDIKARYAEIWSQRIEDPANVRPPGGETVHEVASVYMPRWMILHGLSIVTAICRVKNIPVGRAYTIIPNNVQPIWVDWHPDEEHASKFTEP